MAETWRSIPSIPAYAVSDRGRVRRIAPITGNNGSRRPAGHILTPRALPSGHLKVTLSVGNCAFDKLVHRLVAEAFLPPPVDPRLMVCHRNDVPDHNWPENLYWGTRLDNIADALANDRIAHGERVAGAKLNPDRIREIRALAANGGNQHELAVQFGVSQSNISQIVARQTWRRVA